MISSKRLKKEFLSLALMVVIGGGFYGGLQLLQDWNGKRAFAATGLTPLTLAEAKSLAQEQNKPVLADLSAYWCNVCVKLDREVLAERDVKAHIDKHYVYARIDSESEEASNFMQRYDAKGYPTLVVINSDGSLIKKLEVTFDAAAFLQQL